MRRARQPSRGHPTGRPNGTRAGPARTLGSCWKPCQACVHEPVDGLPQRKVGVLEAGLVCDGVGLEGEEPAIEHRAKGTRRDGGRSQGLGDATVDGLQTVERGLRLADLHLGRGPPLTKRSLGQVASEEGLAGTIFPADGLEDSRATGDRLQLSTQSRLEGGQPDRKEIQAIGGHGAAPQGVDDLATPSRRDRIHAVTHPGR